MTDALDFVVVIPARYAASRLPGKPLRALGGEPLVTHVARRALAAGAREVWVATDDDRIAAALEASGVRIAMTSPDHASGTDRLAECARIAGWGDDRVVVNLQGDEPFAPAAGIRAVAEILVASGAPMSTLAAPIEDARTLFDPNAVKVVRAGGGRFGDALYFSRAPIPWPRDAFARDRDTLPPGGHWLRHIGIYGYRAGFLQRFAALPPSPLETVEALEQLRALEAGYRIAVAATPEPFPPGIDTPEDLERAERTLAALNAGASRP
ncbi:MAG: 3-deoxy-manno-octulosonate cytidylyltransferase [Xanthomonadaceae bacterium]|nr:3-deoxy-manno-octulosonate cytidylyltransferase [Xanthomonadaceae bacterium]